MSQENNPVTSQPRKQPERVLAYIRDHAWSIQPASLETIMEIASRENEYDVEALSAKIGKRLERTHDVEMRGDVAIISAEGPMFRYANLFTMFSGATAYELLARDFNSALEDSKVKSIVLNINSPGGQTDGANEFAGMVYDARKAGNKKIVAYVSHLGASAAYLIASAASEIVIEAMGAVGSIGTVAQVSKGKDKDTVEIVSSQSPNKRPDVTKEEGKAQIQGYVDALAQVFIENVAKHRGVTADTVLKDYGQGGVLVGAQAVKAGMADSVGTLESVIAKLSKQQTRSMTMSLKDATRAQLAAENPTLLEAILKEGRDSGIKTGAEGELARIKAVSEQTMPGHEKLISELMFDGKTTGEQAAVKVLAAERAARGDNLTRVRSDAPAPAPASQDRTAAPAADANKDKVKPVEISSSSSIDDVKAQLKPEFDASAELKAEFGDLDSYAHFKLQESKGRVSYLSSKKAS